MELNNNNANKNTLLNLSHNLIRTVFEYLELIDFFQICNLKRKKLTFIIINSMEIIFDERKIQRFDYIEKDFKCGNCEKNIFVEKKDKIDQIHIKYCKNCLTFICENCKQWQDNCGNPSIISLSEVKIFLAKMEYEEIAKLKMIAIIYTNLYKILIDDVYNFEFPAGVKNYKEKELEFTLIKTNNINIISAYYQNILKEINLKIAMKIYDDRAIYEDVKVIEENQGLLFNSFLNEIITNEIIEIHYYFKYRNCKFCLGEKTKGWSCEKCGSNHTIDNYYDGKDFSSNKCNHCQHIWI